MSLKKVKALLALAWQLVCHFVSKLFSSSPGLKEFKLQYKDDFVFPIPAAYRTLWPQFEKCISCRLCDHYCPDVGQHSFGDFQGPSYILSTLSRGLVDYRYLSQNQVDCSGCRTHSCENVCPELVPISSVLNFVKGYI
ncbi:MAG: hypothetical protein ACD_73C00209G0003 [uncultured bacterium]|nr:MAG: hypothetical protein ACD_73C00209G0003 [uncultured bacterium]